MHRILLNTLFKIIKRCRFFRSISSHVVPWRVHGIHHVQHILLGLTILLSVFFVSESHAKTNTSDYHWILSGIPKEDYAVLSVNIEQRLKAYEQKDTSYTLTNKDIAREVKKALMPFGYFNTHIKVNIEGNNVTIAITLGKRLRFHHIHIMIIGEGKDDPEIKKYQTWFPIHSGDNFSTQDYEQAKQTLKTIAERQGYLKANFTSAQLFIDPEHQEANIHWIFDTQKRFYFGTLLVRRSGISKNLLFRYPKFKYGDPFSYEKIYEFNNYLSGSGYFKSVQISPHVGDDIYVPVHVHTTPVNKVHYSLGLGFGTDTGPRGRLGIHVVPVNEYGHKFDLLTQGSLRENALQAQYTIPGKDPVADQYAFSSQLSSLNYDIGYANTVLFSAAKQHNEKNTQYSFSINQLYERFIYSGFSREEQNMFYPKFYLTRKNITDTLFSPSGFSMTFNAYGSKQGILSPINFAAVTFDGRAAMMYEPIGLRLYLHGVLGTMKINQVEQLPLSLSFNLGGSDNLKAFSFASIGPGKQLVFGGAELQKEFTKNWFITGGYDIGDVYDPTPFIRNQDLSLGLMWVSPVGPIKIGVAQALDEQGRRLEGRNPRLVINMGPDL